MRTALVLLALALAGCASSPVKVQVRGDSYCSIAAPLSWVPADTQPTIHGIRRENAKFNRICRRRK